MTKSPTEGWIQLFSDKEAHYVEPEVDFGDGFITGGPICKSTNWVWGKGPGLNPEPFKGQKVCEKCTAILEERG